MLKNLRVPVLGGVFSLERFIDKFNNQKNKRDRASFNKTSVLREDDVLGLYATKNEDENKYGVNYTLPF